MVAQVREFAKFKGLIPNVDRKRIQEPFVIEGRNFLVDIDGPSSALGRTWMAYREISQPRGVQSLYDTEKEQIFFAVGDSFQMWDEESHNMYPIYTHAARERFLPWTRAHVGGKAYYVNAEFGQLLEYDQTNGIFSIVSGANIPTGLIACCAVGGRLVVVNEHFVAWSAIDDASNEGFAPSTATGAGFQGLSFLASTPHPQTLMATKTGFLVYTLEGILRATLTNVANPFRFDILSKEHSIINPWCITEIVEDETETQIFLTRRGFFSTDGSQRPVIWQPVWSEFLARDLFPHMSLGPLRMNVRLDYDFEKGWFIVSLNESGESSLFSKAYILGPIGEWGVFNNEHCGFVKAHVDEGGYESAHLGLVDPEGTLFHFHGTDSDQMFPDDPGYQVYLRGHFDMPARYVSGSPIVFPTMMRITDDNLRYLVNAGVYDTQFSYEDRQSPGEMPEAEDTVDESGTPLIFASAMAFQVGIRRIVVAGQQHTDYPLFASIKVGLFRTQVPNEAVDCITQFQEGIIGMLDRGIEDTFIDWVEDFTSEFFVDRNTLVDASGDDVFEDWGTAAGPGTNYKATMIGTLDGYQTWTVNNFPQEIELETVLQAGKSRHVSGCVSGQYLILGITADKVGEMFHLKHLRFNMLNAGQLY